MMYLVKPLLIVLTLLFTSAGVAQTLIPYWHSQTNTHEIIQEFADAFNASQSEYQVEPELVGNYEEGGIRLVTAMSAGNAPVLFDAELTIFARLVAEGALLPLDAYVPELDANLLADIYPIVWDNGVVNGVRYGLPFNSSVPLLFYNEDLLTQRQVEVPTSWEAFEQAAERMTTRQTKGYISTSLPLIIESLVNARGVDVLTADGQPNFTSPELTESLQMLTRLAKARHSTNRNMSEIDIAVVDFIRTKGSMAIATSGSWPAGASYSVAFTAKAAPLPLAANGYQPLTGALLTVMEGSSPQEVAGALAFWQFLMQPEHIKRWAEVSYFIPVRRSTAAELQATWATDDVRQIALQLLADNRLRLRPRNGDYANWQRYLSEAVDKAVAGRMSPQEALQEAQSRALGE